MKTILFLHVVLFHFQSEEFRLFWGERSELRRFQDGSICEAVVWPGTTLASKRLIISKVIKHVLNRLSSHTYLI